MSELKQACKGRWTGILKELGAEQRYLTNKHGPCPFCGEGTNRYRFDDKDGNGTFFCSQCGNGDGFEFAMRITGQDFKTVARRIEGIVGHIKPDIQRVKASPLPEMILMGKGLQRLNGKDPASLYLKSRGLSMIASYGLRYHPHMKDRTPPFHSHPAMVAKFQNETGRGTGYHITYLTMDGRKADIEGVKKSWKLEDLNGSALRLAPLEGKHLGIAEGIETALAAMEHTGIPTWATANAGLMTDFMPPAGVEHITIFGDNDPNYTGQAAAYSLAKRLTTKHRIAVEVIFRGEPGDDYLDYLNSIRSSAA
jgi:putative DNA primase/helicase